MSETKVEQWAIVELMGHAQTAGRVEMGALLRVDVPFGELYRTEYYGMAAIYSIRIVSEEIARAYSSSPVALPYNAPVVSRTKYLELENKIALLERGLPGEDDDNEREDRLRVDEEYERKEEENLPF